MMFCPKCKSLCFPDLKDNIQCVKNGCNYVGPTQSIIHISGRGHVNVSDIVMGWSAGHYVCSSHGCYSPVHSNHDYCHNCPGNSGMMPGKYYRAWAY